MILKGLAPKFERLNYLLDLSFNYRIVDEMLNKGLGQLQSSCKHLPLRIVNFQSY